VCPLGGSTGALIRGCWLHWTEAALTEEAALTGEAALTEEAALTGEAVCLHSDAVGLPQRRASSEERLLLNEQVISLVKVRDAVL
jgi:hypothetical protein